MDLWAFKFRDAYTVLQQKVQVLTGNVGPLNILETGLRLLFMLYTLPQEKLLSVGNRLKSRTQMLFSGVLCC